VAGADGERSVAEHRFRARGGDGNRAAAVGARVADVPEVRGQLAVLHLQVGDDGLAGGAPVHHPLAAVDPAALVAADEGGEPGAVVGMSGGGAGAGPVVGAADRLELLEDGAAVLARPLPGALQIPLAAQVPAALPFLAEGCLDLHRGADAGVVRAGET